MAQIYPDISYPRATSGIFTNPTKITNIYKCIDLEEKATFLHFLKNPSILFPYFLLQQSFLPCTEEYQTPWTCALISSSGGSSTSTTPTQTQVPPRVAKEVWKVGLGGRVSGWRVMFLHEMLEYIYIYLHIAYIHTYVYNSFAYIYIYSIHIMYIQMIFPWLWGCWNCLWNETPGVNLNLCLSCMACWISGFPGGLFRQQEDDLIQRCCSTHIVGSLHLLTWMVACYGKCS